VLEALTVDDVRRWGMHARALLALHRADIDRLNVYPVPDGDTGTNLYLSLDTALDRVVHGQEEGGRLGHESVVEELVDLSRELLLSARGNSGVILSQLVRGFADRVAEEGAERIDPHLLAAAVSAAAQRARRSVADPVEGTILTVADAAARASVAAAEAGSTLLEVCRAGTAAANAALARTTEQLAALREAHVVDAGAAGYVLIAEALERVVAGGSQDVVEVEDPTDVASRRRRSAWGIVGEPSPPGALSSSMPQEHVLDPDGPAYEVMYLLETAGPEDVEELRTVLGSLGDSLLVVGGPRLWNVHVHVDDAGAAVEAGLAVGRPSRIRVTHFASQMAARHPAPGGEAPPPPSAPAPAQPSWSDVPTGAIGIVACAAGPGLERVMREHGAVVVPSTAGARASTGALLGGIYRTGADQVVLLPNDKDTVLAAQAAAEQARERGIRVRVIRARTVVQGLAALAVFDRDGDFEDVVQTLSEAAAATRHGGVTVAAREGLTSAGPCRPGDVLGIIDGDFASIGTDLEAVAADMLRRLLHSGGELVTIVVGAGAPEGIADRLVQRLQADHIALEFAVIDGGQEHYPLLFGVE
jgi:DAK2 domain fusion protein YloV